MSIEVKLTAFFQRLAGGAKTLSVEAATVGQLLDNLESHYPGFKKNVINEDGDIHSFITIYLNDEDIRYLQQLRTPLKDGDTLSLLPAMAGGGTVL